MLFCRSFELKVMWVLNVRRFVPTTGSQWSCSSLGSCCSDLRHFIPIPLHKDLLLPKVQWLCRSAAPPALESERWMRCICVLMAWQGCPHGPAGVCRDRFCHTRSERDTGSGHKTLSLLHLTVEQPHLHEFRGRGSEDSLCAHSYGTYGKESMLFRALLWQNVTEHIVMLRTWHLKCLSALPYVTFGMSGLLIYRRCLCLVNFIVCPG